jgi:D-galacturonate reductase
MFVGVCVNKLIPGSGEYTTGFVGDKASDSDKGAGVVGLTMFDLRNRKKTERIGLCGVNGKKFPAIRAHLQRVIGEVYEGLDLTLETYPRDDQVEPEAYLDAISKFERGDVATIFTPDDTHHRIAMACIEQGLHVLITKPVVKTLEEHIALYEAAKKYNVLVAIEVHKRFDPIYVDARDKIQGLGGFSYLYAYMSQPKHQLDTFRAWAGKSSDISYYLNSHHIDFHEWCMGHKARPIRVVGMASTGVAKEQFQIDCEDTITLTVQWENLDGSGLGTAVYTSSWVAPKVCCSPLNELFFLQREKIGLP